MNKFLKLLFVAIIGLSIVSCSKDDDNKSVPLRDYTEQYAKDLDTIDEFIDTHYMTVSPNFDVTFANLPNDGSQLSIRNQTDYPLEHKIVNAHGIDYKVYYIKLREGVNKRPSAVDSVMVSYSGRLISLTQFDAAASPVWLKLDGVVRGWTEIVPMFKTGTYETGEGPNPVNFFDYGAGIMFVPSGLGYYGQAVSGVPSYSSLIFNFKLYELRYRDHDNDGILSKDEVETPGDDPKEYDSDEDGIANMYDVDDDNDHYLTRTEISDEDGNIIDPLPMCGPTLKHLDPNCF